MLRTMYSYSSSQLQTLKTSNALYVWFIMIHLFMPWNTARKKVLVPPSFQVSTNYMIHPAYPDISVFQQWVKRCSVDSCPLPNLTSFGVTITVALWENLLSSFTQPHPVKNHPHWLQHREHSVPIPVLYLHTFSICSHWVVCFMQHGVIKWWNDGTAQLISLEVAQYVEDINSPVSLSNAVKAT